MINGARQQIICNKGLTLVELMVSTVLILIILVSLGTVFLNGQSSFNYLEGSANNIQEARIGQDQLSRDLRTATQISSASATSIEFTGDYDGNGTTETITYAQSGSNLNRTIGTGSSKQMATGIVNAVSEPVFSYYDQDGVAVTDGTLAKLIQIRLLVDKDTAKSPSRSIELISKVQLRNLHERR